MNIIEKLNWRYATKKFDKLKILPKEKVDVLKEAFNLTATSYGLQTMKLAIVSDDKTKSKLVDLCYGQEQVNNASHVLVICIQDKVDESDVDNHFDNIKKTRNTPEIILSKYKKEQKEFLKKRTDDEIKKWCINQAYIALGNLMTVCAVEDIDACPMEGFLPEKVDELLKLDTYNLKSVLLLPIGYRAEDDMFSNFKKVRKDIKETVIEL